MAAAVRSARASAPRQLEISDPDAGALGDDQVPVEIRYCGVCRTDVHAR